MIVVNNFRLLGGGASSMCYSSDIVQRDSHEETDIMALIMYILYIQQEKRNL